MWPVALGPLPRQGQWVQQRLWETPLLRGWPPCGSGDSPGSPARGLSPPLRPLLPALCRFQGHLWPRLPTLHWPWGPFLAPTSHPGRNQKVQEATEVTTVVCQEATGVSALCRGQYIPYWVTQKTASTHALELTSATGAPFHHRTHPQFARHSQGRHPIPRGSRIGEQEPRETGSNICSRRGLGVSAWPPLALCRLLGVWSSWVRFEAGSWGPEGWVRGCSESPGLWAQPPGHPGLPGCLKDREETGRAAGRLTVQPPPSVRMSQ